MKSKINPFDKLRIDAEQRRSIKNQKLKIKKVPKVSEVPKASEGKKTSKVEKTSKESKAPKLPELPKVSEVPQVSKVSKVPPKLPRLPKQPKSSSEPKTMEELMKMANYQFHGLKKGQTVDGVVTDIRGRTIMLDIGAKTEGVVMDKDYEESAEMLQRLKVGDKIKVVVYSPENEKGQLLLSVRQAVNDYKWDLFDKYLKTNEIIEARGLEINRGGLIARLMGVRGFIPSSQFGSQYLGKLDSLQNRILKVKIIEVDRAKNRLIFSEKAVSEAAVLAQKQQALKKVKVGETYSGIVSGVMPFGIFVRVELEQSPSPSTGSGSGQSPSTGSGQSMFLEGLVHISEISWEKVDDVNKFYKVGDKVKVKVLGADSATAKLNLSVKQLLTDPWLEAIKNFPLDKKTKGEVTRLASFGAFVQLAPGIEGLIHISKIPSDMDIAVGKAIDVYVESVEPEKRRMSLGVVLTEKPVGYK